MVTDQFLSFIHSLFLSLNVIIIITLRCIFILFSTIFKATDKYRGVVQINVQQPAIVLLNPEDTGSLLETPMNEQQEQTAQYWRQRATSFVMGT